MTIMADDYKASKEAFVSGTTGSSVMHINVISSVALVCLPNIGPYCPVISN